MDIHEKLWSSLWETIAHFPDCTVRLFCETSPCDACPVCLTYLSFHFYHLHITSKLLHFPAEALAYISFQENAFPPNIYSYIEQFTFHCCSKLVNISKASVPSLQRERFESALCYSSLKLCIAKSNPPSRGFPFKRLLKHNTKGGNLLTLTGWDTLKWDILEEREEQICPQHLTCKLASYRL